MIVILFDNYTRNNKIQRKKHVQIYRTRSQSRSHERKHPTVDAEEVHSRPMRRLGFGARASKQGKFQTDSRMRSFL